MHEVAYTEVKMLNSFLEKHRYTLLGAVLIVLILAFFCFVDVPYTIYGVSVDSQMAEPDVFAGAGISSRQRPRRGGFDVSSFGDGRGDGQW